MSHADLPHRPRTRDVALRALRLLCPACGLGDVFTGGLRSAPECSACSWAFERGEGHWIGGAEINMILTYWTACLTFLAVHVVFTMSLTTMVAATLFTVAVALLLYRVSRSAFIALDFLVDPVPDDDEGGDGGGGDDRPHPRIPLIPAPRAQPPRGADAPR